MALPIDRKGRVGFLDVERLGVARAGEPEGEVIVAVEEPGVAGFGGKQRELTDDDDAAIVVGGAALDGADLIGKTKARAIDQALAGAAFVGAAAGARFVRSW